MIQGATSDAGKSALVTGICRALYRNGWRVAPFKPQNMALNSAVTADGGEIGRAQAVQAQACGLEPSIHMNPILLKPNSDCGAQVIVQGKALTDMQAQTYHDYKPVAMQAVLQSYNQLQQHYNAIIVEGAGSPAEINLRAGDIANMGFAEQVDCPVILIADIDRGGVFAHLVGTLALLSQSERDRVKGFVINKFRGDIKLLQSGLDWLQQETGKPVLGVLPYLHGLHLEAEDAIQSNNVISNGSDVVKVVVPVLPRISNHTDFDALRWHPQVDLQFIAPDQSIPPADLMILPGSKSVRADLAWLREQGWPQAIQRHLRYRGKILGICGGLQMLGNWVHDRHGIEGAPGSAEGLGLLDLVTEIETEKQLFNVSGKLNTEYFGFEGHINTGYEIHAGRSVGPALDKPLFTIQRAGSDNSQQDGAVSADGQIIATYLHGLFESAEITTAILKWAGLNNAQKINYRELQEQGINRIADTCEQHLDIALLLKILNRTL